MRLELTRIGEFLSGTWGYMPVGTTTLFTVERPWVVTPYSEGGKPSVSCVPEGFYILEPHSSTDHGPTWALVGEHVSHFQVPGIPRNLVLFHAANFPEQLEGCIAPGISIGSIGGRVGVQHSQDAMELLREKMSVTESHQLVIRRGA